MHQDAGWGMCHHTASDLTSISEFSIFYNLPRTFTDFKMTNIKPPLQKYPLLWNLCL